MAIAHLSELCKHRTMMRRTHQKVKDHASKTLAILQAKLPKDKQPSELVAQEA